MMPKEHLLQHQSEKGQKNMRRAEARSRTRARGRRHSLPELYSPVEYEISIDEVMANLEYPRPIRWIL